MSELPHQTLKLSPKLTILATCLLRGGVVPGIWDRSFSNSGPKMWNSLPSALRQPGLSFAVFKQHLISYLFEAMWHRGA